RVRTPIIIYGTYLRPFIYRGITYVASYGADGDKEVMAIDKYSFTGRTDAVTGRPQWSGWMRPRNLGHSNYLKNLESRVGLSSCLAPGRAKKVMPARARAKKLIQRAP